MARFRNCICRALARRQFTDGTRIRVYRKLLTDMRAGLPLVRSLDRMVDFASRSGIRPGAPLACILTEWRERLSNGESFGRAVRGWVPEAEEFLLDGQSGRELEEALQHCIELGNVQAGGSRAVLKAFAFPVVFLIGAALFLATIEGS
ncbi:hypothetical protein AD929_04330 [Gluconobacter potus]|uniref:Uncharacterized protein n=1 Tax=Gluconobacter potus TaxID=2724927 RepID=A0A149QY24_9PROT|nr:type II secretion system F family protein [Gluconobacter potus]KXV02037.1 hypothetical protein AD929_04330 [Gluconobacter potus]